MTFEEIAEYSHLDLAARKQLRKLEQAGKYASLGQALEKEPKWMIDRFVLETTDPASVGMQESLADQFDPEELVRMMSRPPHVIDWDMLEVA